MLPALQRLVVDSNGLGEASASALAAAIGEGRVPGLQYLGVKDNELGEARSARWQRLADRLRVPLMPLDTQHDLVEQLREHLSVRHPSARP